MNAEDLPRKVGGLPVLAACPSTDYLPLSGIDGMRGPGRGDFRAFHCLAVCAEDDGSVFVFYCAADWQTIADDWYPTLEDALHSLEKRHPGIGATLVRVPG